ncbi:MAG: AbrB/MazE/SpoVT family DNA-binding domain-containing protein [Candidatus Binatus sp.]|uniref:AbrB/MazE/SpoVT family DNA-binding domain-containing protein n=1 Tax=Candidatus Binatus sp. TaxID=2811406 RepID=UPI003BB17DA2
MKSRVSERGQVTIPKRLRDRLRIEPGTELQFSEENGRLIAVIASSIDPVGEVFGYLGERLDTDAVVVQLRGRR